MNIRWNINKRFSYADNVSNDTDTLKYEDITLRNQLHFNYITQAIYWEYVVPKKCKCSAYSTKYN